MIKAQVTHIAQITQYVLSKCSMANFNLSLHLSTLFIYRILLNRNYLNHVDFQVIYTVHTDFTTSPFNNMQA